MFDANSMGLLIPPLAALASALAGDGVSEARWGLRSGVRIERHISGNPSQRAPRPGTTGPAPRRRRAGATTERRPASLHLSVPPFRTSTGWAYPYLMLRNNGPATAIDVQLRFHPLDRAEHGSPAVTAGVADQTGDRQLQPAPPSLLDGEATVSALGSAEVISFGISPPWAEPARWQVELCWTDDTGWHIERRLVAKQEPS
ncbi:MAG: hypothetical protein QOJ19_3556 [Acidimicrobiia bacterium]|nr:hypothetical protein [Acidimicrobiia bacterium]